ncbi:MAG: hypothetical protein BWY69_00586 [Planctomycetes bacterium ADurb.Bin401]|nr:MAG: hypothetical protein BWY69_00586 [Planctomycetes bacterium ADurb.Bin401]
MVTSKNVFASSPVEQSESGRRSNLKFSNYWRLPNVF